MNNRYTEQSTLLQSLNSLKGYQGYVQFSHRPIDNGDIFLDTEIDIKMPEQTDAFLYEAHFYSKDEKRSISIRYINGAYYKDETDLCNKELKVTKEKYLPNMTHMQTKLDNHYVAMAQIWQKEDDEYCCGFKTQKLKKVVFAGFKKEGEES